MSISFARDCETAARITPVAVCIRAFGTRERKKLAKVVFEMCHRHRNLHMCDEVLATARRVTDRVLGTDNNDEALTRGSRATPDP